MQGAHPLPGLSLPVYLAFSENMCPLAAETILLGCDDPFLLKSSYVFDLSMDLTSCFFRVVKVF